MDPLTAKVTEALSRYNMLDPDSPVGVAVSGGADSICLLHVFASIQQQLTVIHVNHHLRGEESDADQQFVLQLAANMGLKALAFPVHLPAEGNLEEAARDARRAIFQSLITSGVVGRVALAHTRSDQAETVLFRLLRGAYTTGLAGMRPVTPDGLIRPMLDVTRSEVEAWLIQRNLPWRDDSSNADPQFARNRIRHSLLPQLVAEWNPALPEILANHARLAQEDEDYWNTVVSSFTVERRPDASLILDIRQLPRAMAIRRRVIRDIIRRAKGDLKQIDYRHIQQVLLLTAEAGGHGRVQIPGVDVMKSFDWVCFAKPRTAPAERDWCADIAVPGTAEVRNGDEILFQLHDTLVPGGLDWHKIVDSGGSLKVRNWRPGDRYQPVGHSHDDKVKTMFHDARIPLWERRDWPMVCLGDHVVWSRRFGPASSFAASANSDVVLLISERKRIGAGL